MERNLSASFRTLHTCAHAHMYSHITCTHMQANMHIHTTTCRHVQKRKIEYNSKLNCFAIITILKVYKGHVELVITKLHNKKMFIIFIIKAESLNSHCSRPFMKKTKLSEYFSH